MTFQKDPDQNEKKHLYKFADFVDKRILEIGAGEGRLTWNYADQPGLTTCIDSDRDSLRVAMIDRPSDLEEKVLFSNAMAEHLPFSREMFDVALLAWSF